MSNPVQTENVMKASSVPEVQPLLSPSRLESLEAQDAAFAMRLAEQEASRHRREEMEANARAWDAHYRCKSEEILAAVVDFHHCKLLTLSQQTFSTLFLTMFL